MCRILFYTVDPARMQRWLRHACAAPPLICNSRVNSPLYEFDDAANTDSSFAFLNDLSRERSLVSWARGVVRHTLPAQHADTKAWLPPRDALILHSTVDPRAYECLLERGALATDGADAPAMLSAAERAFLDELKPLLGIWYGRLVMIRSRGQPCLVAQVNARAWLETCAHTMHSVGESNPREDTGSTGALLLDYPPAWAVLCKSGSVVEMFGAEHSDMCCCSLVEKSSHGNLGMADLEGTFLDALGLALLSSVEGTVLLDIDADYAEA